MASTMRVFWFQFEILSEAEGLVTVVVDAVDDYDAARQLRAMNLEIVNDPEGIDFREILVNDAEPWLAEQLRRFAMVPRRKVITKQEMTGRYGIICGNPDEPGDIERLRQKAKQEATN